MHNLFLFAGRRVFSCLAHAAGEENIDWDGKGAVAMAILLACGEEGLLLRRETWQALPMPLRCASLVAAGDDRLAVVDDEAHQLWTGESVVPVPGGVEALRVWRGRFLVLSGDTDCMTVLDAQSGSPLIAAPAGVYPQDLCLIPGEDLAAVCGGADGSVRLMRLPSLMTVRLLRVPGSAQRITFFGGWLYVLCAAEDDGLKCLLCRVPLRGGRYDPLCTLPGLPGAIRADASGGLWVAASEGLYYFPPGESSPDRTLLGQGLIRHLDQRAGGLLVTDPVLGRLSMVDARARAVAQTLYEGDVRQGLFV